MHAVRPTLLCGLRCTVKFPIIHPSHPVLQCRCSSITATISASVWACGPPIRAMPVEAIAAHDAHCWLSVTNATLRAGFDVLEAWGFTPRSPLTWVKPRLGLGQYLRNATEHLILGTRGAAPVRYRAQPTWMGAPLQEHSHKPEEQIARAGIGTDETVESSGDTTPEGPRSTSRTDSK
jgi:N6-adenosine-specific RNA methylase IME4